jgi:glycosyltransferase involved in cell wall biosynthesis
MMEERPRRVMWLLNHTAARNFEIPMLKSIGFGEIFTPKSFPQAHDFRSASVDYSQDEYLTIPAEDLKILNETDWYKSVSRNVWEIANRHFDVVFFISYNFEAAMSAARHFQGALVLRAYGLPGQLSYSSLLRFASDGASMLKNASQRLWFGAAYDNLTAVEGAFLSSRQAYLPLGIADSSPRDDWEGTERKVLFVCPDLGFNPYYRGIYEDFVKQFGDLPHAIGGAQPILVRRPNVLGFIPRKEYEQNMRRFRVMYYHSTEPRHLHYHPIEAIRQGMPLVFMGGGLLDRLAGKKLPGRASSRRNARSKLERILNGDRKLIADIRSSQTVLLDAMRSERLRSAWQHSMATIVAGLPSKPVNVTSAVAEVSYQKRVAVIVPAGYRGGSLRGAKLLARAIYEGSRQVGEDVQVVFGHLDTPDLYTDDEWRDLPAGISRRPFNWKDISGREAEDAMRLAGFPEWTADSLRYVVPDDGMKHFGDCDAWIIISDRFLNPILPLRPRIHMVYDYLQRYVPFSDLSHGKDAPFLDCVHRADQVMVTTEFTRLDAIQYAGLPVNKVKKVPMLAPLFQDEIQSPASPEAGYFIWTTNAGPHKNHERALEALLVYYGELEGHLKCRITGVNTRSMFDGSFSTLKRAGKLWSQNRILRRNVQQLGELLDDSYKRTLAGSKFLWHTALIDNGTFSVVEAACLGVPSLSSDYPAMREIDAQFALNLSFFDAWDPREMAMALKSMERRLEAKKIELPGRHELNRQSVERLAGVYWATVREWL